MQPIRQIIIKSRKNINMYKFHRIKKTAVVAESDVLKCISDEKRRDILTIIHEGRALLMTGLNLTRKQYYSRLHGI